MTVPSPKVIIVLCYKSPNGSFIIPDCPFCFCSHRHMVRNLEPLVTKNCNSVAIPFEAGMATKVSDCLSASHIYALELRKQEDVPFEKTKMCRGITNAGVECKRKARKDSCVCSIHKAQLGGILDNRWSQLTTQLNT